MNDNNNEDQGDDAIRDETSTYGYVHKHLQDQVTTNEDASRCLRYWVVACGYVEIGYDPHEP
mgnify:CR=1 FL=1